MPRTDGQSPRVRNPLPKALSRFWDFSKLQLDQSNFGIHHDGVVAELKEIAEAADPSCPFTILLDKRPQAFRMYGDGDPNGLSSLEALEETQRLYRVAIPSIYLVQHYHEAFERGGTWQEDEDLFNDSLGIEFVAESEDDFRGTLAREVIGMISQRMSQFALLYDICLYPDFRLTGERILVPRVNDLRGLGALTILESWVSKKPLVRECAYSKCSNLLVPLKGNHRTCCWKCRVKYAEEKRREDELL